MENRKYLVVVNPLTGRKGQRHLAQLSTILHNENISYDTFYTEADVQQTEQKLVQRVTAYTDVVAIGGDGTLNMLCNLLAHKNIALGIIPCGTGNDFSRHIYKKSDDIFKTVTQDNSIQIDLGKCQQRYFINVLGVGYDGMVAEQTCGDKKMMFRSFFYLWHALKYLLVFKEQNIELRSPHFQKDEKTFMVVFGNGTFFGNGMNITPNADITDGVLDCCWIGQLSFFKKCYCLIKLYSGKHLSTRNIEYVHGKEFEVTTKGHPIEADGEFIGYTPAHIQSVEKALLLKVP
jgi:YegS/Rv2252/BmrU family lipid kinase